jgi:gamma-glutamyl phosphate reductase
MTKDNLLLSIAENIRNEKDKIITANNEDLNLAKKNKMPKAMLNRLMLDR